MSFSDIPSEINQGLIVRAAQYVRMSTDHQRYSTENQSDAIKNYAHRHGMIITKTYSDEGRSGLSFDGRNALKQLIEDVQSGNFDFQVILVYDISRWGRFQDSDESAYYEYICKRAGIQLIYCAEQFANDGSMPSTVMKNLKRVMAGEYSRELSNKVFIGQCRLIELGFRQGGPAGYGLRRLLVNGDHQPKTELSRGEHKSVQTDRVILVPGPPEEVATVQRIYHLFLACHQTEQQIADTLNAEGIKTDLGRAWTRGVVHQILTNEKYIGNNVFNRTSFKLKVKRVKNLPDKWVRSDGAFQGIVDPGHFLDAHTIISARSRHISNDEMLHRLRQLYEKTGMLSGIVIDEQEGLPSSNCYRSRFGSLMRAYTLVGFDPARDYRYLEINRSLRLMVPELTVGIKQELLKVGASVDMSPSSDLLLVNQEFTISIVIARCVQKSGGNFRWRIRFDRTLRPDFSIVVRMNVSNKSPLDYYVFPRIDLPLSGVQLDEDNSVSLDAYRFDSLDAFYSLSERISLSEVA